MPALVAFARSAYRPHPVSATIEILPQAWRLRMRIAASYPSSTGMPMSMTITSGLKLAADCTAAAPSVTRATSCPSISSSSLRLVPASS